MITLAPLEQMTRFNITIIDDNILERQSESFSVLLEIAPGQEKVSGLTLSQFSSQIIINDDDCKYKFHVAWLLTGGHVHANRECCIWSSCVRLFSRQLLSCVALYIHTTHTRAYYKVLQWFWNQPI